jgi:hypothetical protein
LTIASLAPPQGGNVTALRAAAKELQAKHRNLEIWALDGD